MRHQYIVEGGETHDSVQRIRVFETRGSKIAFHAPTNSNPLPEIVRTMHTPRKFLCTYSNLTFRIYYATLRVLFRYF